MKNLGLPIIGVLMAIAITSTMDATGLTDFSSLILFPLMALFWFLDRLPRRDVGFAFAPLRYFGLALFYPTVVLGAVAIVAGANGATDFSDADWGKALANLALVTVSTFLVAILTEEGFFRGWLWGSLVKAGVRRDQVLFWTSVAFSLWHWSAITLDTGFNVPIHQIPIFMLNAAILGAIWGVMRDRSCSVLVASLSHGLWNGAAYVFFGYGTHAGALGITNTALYGPEVGFLGLGLNIGFLVLLLLLSRNSAAPKA